MKDVVGPSEEAFEDGNRGRIGDKLLSRNSELYDEQELQAVPHRREAFVPSLGHVLGVSGIHARLQEDGHKVEDQNRAPDTTHGALNAKVHTLSHPFGDRARLLLAQEGEEGRNQGLIALLRDSSPDGFVVSLRQDHLLLLDDRLRNLLFLSLDDLDLRSEGSNRGLKFSKL